MQIIVCRNVQGPVVTLDTDLRHDDEYDDGFIKEMRVSVERSTLPVTQRIHPVVYNAQCR